MLILESSYYLSIILLIVLLGFSKSEKNNEHNLIEMENQKIEKNDAILLVANKHSNTLSFINPVTLEVIETIPTGNNPHEIVVTPDQRYAYLSSYAPPGDKILVIDLIKREEIKQINTGEFTRIHGAAMAPDGENAYFTAGQTGYVVEVDTKTNKVTRGIPTHGEISHMVYVSPDNKTLFTGNITSGNVSVIDRSSGDLITILETGRGTGGMAFSPDGKTLWVLAGSDETISIIDLTTHKVIETFECSGDIRRIRFTDDGKLALITSWTVEGEVIVLDVASRQVIERIDTCSRTIGVEISPDGNRAFFGCEDAEENENLEDGNGSYDVQVEMSNGVQVMNMKTFSIEAVIKTGLGPDPMVMWFPPE